MRNVKTPLFPFTCSDESGYRVEILSTDAEAAANEYVAGGDWEGSDGAPITVSVFREGDFVDSFDIAVEGAREPECSHENGHFWTREAGWVYGSDHGGVWTKEQCKHCGVVCETDTGATNPSNGTRYTRVTYS